MSNNKYFIKTGGLNEFVLNTDNESNKNPLNPADANSDTNTPAAKDNPLTSPQDAKVVSPNIIGIAVKGSSTSTTATGEVPSKNALSGYEPIDNEKNNSEIVDKTPENSELNDPSKLKNDEPSTSEEEHPHQIQSGETEKSHKTEMDIDASNSGGVSPQSGEVDIEVDEKLTPEHEKVQKLESLCETYSKRPFLTMREVLLLNKSKKILSSIKK